MRDLIVTEFVTLDGVMEAPGGEHGHPHTGWVFDYVSREQEEYKFDEVLSADIHLLGRVTYESFADAWPGRGGAFADRMNEMQKVVVSTTLQDPEWNNTTVISSVPDQVRQLKEGDGGPILVAGSRSLVQPLIEHDLVDEFHLQVFPVVLGSGARLFPESPDKRPLELVDSRVFPSGVVAQTYRPKRD
jgi:dihydrofolate reductase